MIAIRIRSRVQKDGRQATARMGTASRIRLLSRRKFQRRWLEVHGPLARRLRKQLPQMKRYVQSHTIAGEAGEALRASRGAAQSYDGISEIWFDSIEAMGGDAATAADAARQLLEDEAEFLNFAESSLFLTEEHEIF